MDDQTVPSPPPDHASHPHWSRPATAVGIALAVIGAAVLIAVVTDDARAVLYLALALPPVGAFVVLIYKLAWDSPTSVPSRDGDRT